ncbi:hypothetical protein DFH09DRAFT_1092636 [Mycena vulgaris]|nr:hypothetical protein DFH09DRAFT_1092636 [Mycena vulgaris]
MQVLSAVLRTCACDGVPQCGIRLVYIVCRDVSAALQRGSTNLGARLESLEGDAKLRQADGSLIEELGGVCGRGRGVGKTGHRSGCGPSGQLGIRDQYRNELEIERWICLSHRAIEISQSHAQIVHEAEQRRNRARHTVHVPGSLAQGSEERCHFAGKSGSTAEDARNDATREGRVETRREDTTVPVDSEIPLRTWPQSYWEYSHWLALESLNHSWWYERGRCMCDPHSDLRRSHPAGPGMHQLPHLGKNSTVLFVHDCK